MRRANARVGSTIGAVAVVACLPVPATAAGASAPSCVPGSSGIVATLGSWSEDQDRIDSPGTYGRGDEPFLMEVRGFEAGLGRLAATSEDVVPAALRVTPRPGGGRRLELCEGRGLIAVGPALASGTKLGGLSVSGDRIAWRMWRPGTRGVVAVGRVAGRGIVGVRTTRVPVLAPDRRVNGRLLVAPDGTAAWSLEVGGRAAVWLWPRGRDVRRLALPADRRRARQGWDVRIVDDRHVLLGRTDTVLRYGPTTPGRCPAPIGATDAPFAGGRLVRVPGAAFVQSTDISRWSHALLCDPTVGDYVDVHTSAASGGKYGFDSGGDALGVLATAGTVVHVDASNSSGAPIHSTVVVRATSASTVASGRVADPTAPEPVRPLPTNLSPTTPIGLAVVPGAVAWIAADPAPFESVVPADRRIWLADARGARIVGALPDEGADDPRLALTADALTWTVGATTSTVPVAPVPGDVVERLDLGD